MFNRRGGVVRSAGHASAAIWNYGEGSPAGTINFSDRSARVRSERHRFCEELTVDQFCDGVRVAAQHSLALNIVFSKKRSSPGCPIGTSMQKPRKHGGRSPNWALGHVVITVDAGRPAACLSTVSRHLRKYVCLTDHVTSLSSGWTWPLANPPIITFDTSYPLQRACRRTGPRLIWLRSMETSSCSRCLWTEVHASRRGPR